MSVLTMFIIKKYKPEPNRNLENMNRIYQPLYQPYLYIYYIIIIIKNLIFLADSSWQIVNFSLWERVNDVFHYCLLL